MRPLPLRARLAVWYCAVLTASVVGFSLLAFFEMRSSIGKSVDGELQDRLNGFYALLQRESSFKSAAGIAAVLADHTGGNDLFRMADSGGAWIYRSPTADTLAAGLPPLGRVGEPGSIATARLAGKPLRILTTTLNLAGGSYRVQVGESIGPYETTTAHFGRVMVASIPLLLIVALIGGFWLSRRALVPVDRITRATQDITAQSLSERLEVPKTNDELQRLSETLNAMLQRLEQSFQRITQFTADASHELKTPLAVIRTMAEVPLRLPSSAADYREALTGIVSELDRTSKLVDDLLSVARGDSGPTAIVKAPIDLVAVLSCAAAQGELMAQRRQLSFHSSFGEAPIQLSGDRDALQRLVVILLDNATKYTPPAGKVTLTAFRQDDQACVQVTDTGIGIAEADLPRVFERFFRADKARSRATPGSGLGLAIARWIAVAHGGTIEVESSLGRGSVFSVRLPVIR